MPESATTRFEDIAIGSAEQFEVTLTDEMVRRFALLSGDFNPLHMDDEYASQTPLGRRIAHGMLGASLFSRLVGMHVPGRHALYLSQTLLFRKPCEIGATVVVRGSVTHKTEATKTITLHTSVFDRADDTCLIEGDAMVRLLI